MFQNTSYHSCKNFIAKITEGTEQLLFYEVCSRSDSVRQCLDYPQLSLQIWETETLQLSSQLSHLCCKIISLWPDTNLVQCCRWPGLYLYNIFSVNSWEMRWPSRSVVLVLCNKTSCKLRLANFIVAGISRNIMWATDILLQQYWFNFGCCVSWSVLSESPTE